MNHRMVFYTVGELILVEAALLLLPLMVSAIYRETAVSLAFLRTIAGALILGGAMVLFLKPKTEEQKRIYAKDGFVVCALAWLTLSAVGAVPFVLSGDIPSYVDAWFETVSGFTTTGASILVDVENLSHGAAFWRSFSHWIGGMGVLVLMMAILPMGENGRSIHIMRAEMPGPVVGKLVPKVRDTAKILYLIYIAMTVLQIILLTWGGMSLFESVVHTFGTAGTGGFGVKADSIASYSPYLQWVITIFMMLFGVNFNLYYMLLLRNVKGAIRNQELWTYLGIAAVSTAVIAWNVRPMFDTIGETVRQAAFQVASVITTTGYATTDFDKFPLLSKTVLFLLMIVGGCAGSTAGGIKVSRIVLLFKQARQNLRKMLHPRAVNTISLDGKPVEAETMNNLSAYLIMYCAGILGTFLLLSNEPFDFETNLTAAVSCFNNVGPAFGAAGPAGNYAGYSAFAKVVLSCSMLMGRLEIIPLLVTVTPSTWRKGA